MPEASLYPVSPLGKYSQTFDDTSVCEINGLAIITVALPLEGRQSLDKKLEQMCNLPFPDAGVRLCTDENINNRIGTSVALLGMQVDQCLLVIEPTRQPIEQAIAEIIVTLETDAYLTDQSDSLAVLEIHGSLAVPVLERLCMLDINAFTSNQVARTAMEHMSVILEKTDTDHFRMYTPRSSAKDFLHTITTSLSSVSHA